MSQQPPYNGYQQGYQQPPAQPGYGYQQPYYGYQPPAEHPQAQTVFILGIVGIFTGILSFVAWYLGAEAKKEIEAGAPYPFEGKLKTGYLLGKILGIISLACAGLGLLLLIVYFVMMLAIFGAFM